MFQPCTVHVSTLVVKGQKTWRNNKKKPTAEYLEIWDTTEEIFIDIHSCVVVFIVDDSNLDLALFLYLLLTDSQHVHHRKCDERVRLCANVHDCDFVVPA